MTRAVRWCASLADGPNDGTTAWVVTLAACRAFVHPALAPNATDRADIGGRRGVDAERFLTRRLTLRSLVARWCGVPAEQVVVGYDKAGRPEVLWPADRPFCSVAAHGDLAGLALAHGPVGVDFEPEIEGAIADAVLSTEERIALGRVPHATRLSAFLRIWTVKEAYLKALGTGLLRDPTTLNIAQTEGILTDGSDAFRLSASACRSLVVDDQPVAAACISLPG